MKIVWMHVRIFLCLTSLLILLGIVTVSPCAWGEKCSLFGRKYHWDEGRLEELTDKVRNTVCRRLKPGA